jgi:hypothetical protein
LYIDSDQILYPDTIEKLVLANVPVISPVIVRKVWPHMPTCISHDRAEGIDADIQSAFYKEDFRTYDRDIIPVKYPCGGLVLIGRKAVESVITQGKRPFYPEKNDSGDLLSVDYSFFEQVRRAGMCRMYVHRSARCGHLGWYAFDVTDYYGQLDAGLTVEKDKSGKYHYIMGDKHEANQS